MPESGFARRVTRQSGDQKARPPRSVQRLTVGRVDDPAEREAEQMATEVLGLLAAPDVDDAAGIGAASPTRIRRTVRRAPAVIAPGLPGAGAAGGEVDDATSDSIESAVNGGAPLSTGVRRAMEDGFGADFGSVRVHTDAAADDAAQRVEASAFTTGSDIVFAKGRYQPDTDAGRHVLAHELTHVVQQAGGTGRTIRRMPSATKVKTETGKKSKAGIKILGGLGGTKHYNAVLKALEGYREYLLATAISPNMGAMSKQLVVIIKHLDAISTACTEYLTKPDADPNVVSVLQRLQGQIPTEKMLAGEVGAKFARNPLTGGNPKWFMQLPEDPGQTKKGTDQLKVTEVGTQGERGNNKEVKQVTNAKGEGGYFAEDDPTGKYDDDEKYGNATFVLERYGVKDDVKLGNRSVAMSRIDSLLNAGVIALTERAVKDDKSGTFMAGAQGDQAKAILDKHPELKDDANYARLLSRLHLVDLLCGQIDRHAGNYFIQRDQSGKVIGITGIDLDMAFMPQDKKSGRSRVSVEKGSHAKSDSGTVDHLPGLSEYVDADLAERIIDLKPEDLRAVLSPLLDEDAVEGAVERLEALQEALIKLQNEGKLLERGMWTKEVLNAQREESKKSSGLGTKGGKGSYFGRDTKAL